MQTDTLTDCNGAEPTLLHSLSSGGSASHNSSGNKPWLCSSRHKGLRDSNPLVSFSTSQASDGGPGDSSLVRGATKGFSLRVRHGLFSSLLERNGTSK